MTVSIDDDRRRLTGDDGAAVAGWRDQLVGGTT